MDINGHLISTSTTNLALEKEELRIHLQASKEAQRRLTREVGNTLMDEAVHFLRHYHTQESNDDDELNAERNLDENPREAHQKQLCRLQDEVDAGRTHKTLQ